jgi:hypothetical protein
VMGMAMFALHVLRPENSGDRLLLGELEGSHSFRGSHLQSGYRLLQDFQLPPGGIILIGAHPDPQTDKACQRVNPAPGC